MRVKTNLKAGNIFDSAADAYKKVSSKVKQGWDKLPNWLTWPW